MEEVLFQLTFVKQLVLGRPDRIRCHHATKRICVGVGMAGVSPSVLFLVVRRPNT